MAGNITKARAFRLGSLSTRHSLRRHPSPPTTYRHESSQSQKPEDAKSAATTESSNADLPKKKKTIAELDEELKQKLEGASGEGGAAGLEFEDGKAVAMKRSVKNNMFRYI